MSLASAEAIKSDSPIKRALRALDDMQTRLDAMEYARKEPIAIVGMGCRFPGGADHPDAFWQLLQTGGDGICEIPPDRWNVDEYYDPNPDAPGKMHTRHGGFLQQVDQFDAPFFGISAREAMSIDPQQRLLLEVSWEALEYANQAPERLTNSSTGVFVGIYMNDYAQVIRTTADPTQMDAFYATGSSHSVAAGRLSYLLGLKGPTLAIDTACSSSLVAVHLACQSLRNRECNLALAGGVSLILAPDSAIALSKSRMLNPDGRCKTFDASSNGFVKGEGCGVLVLKRLSEAIADGDKILSVIRGSAVNHNGRSSSLIAPHGPSQQEVMRQALEQAGISPTQVSYVEVQGTGTAVGEPIEVGALANVFCKNRAADDPLTIGSVKTNIGHLEAASGMASLIKVILSMQHQAIPPHLHFQQPNPYINWNELPLQVPTTLTPWHSNQQKRVAGICAFGFSGTNAHIVLEEAPSTLADWNQHGLEAQGGNGHSQLSALPDRPCHILTLSAKNADALHQLVGRYQHYLHNHPDLSLADLCFSANIGRSHLPYRLSMVATSIAELQEKLTAFQTGQTSVGLFHGKANPQPQKAFVFSAQDQDWLILGQYLAQTHPTFSTLDPKDPRSVQEAFSQLWQTWGIPLAQAAQTGTWMLGQATAAELVTIPLQTGSAVWSQLLTALAQMYVQGTQVDWVGFDQGYSRHRLHLPTYPWQRQRYWVTSAGETPSKAIAAVPHQIPSDVLVQQLQKSGQFSPEELQVLPKLLDHLAKLQSSTLQNNTPASQASPSLTLQVLTAEDIQAWLIDRIASELGVKAEELDPTVPFDSYGLDSVLAIGIASAGKQFLGIEVSPLMLVHYPTIAALSQHLAEQLDASESEIFEI